MSLNLNDVLNQLDSGTEKTASANPAGPSDAATSNLHAAIKEAAASLRTVPSANPADKLEAMANKLASADAALLTKEAETYGAAMADGFVSRLGSYNNDATTKTASDAEYVMSEKTAQEFAQGVVEGYTDAITGGNVKTASDAAAELSTVDPGLVKLAQEVLVGYHEGLESVASAGQFNKTAAESAYNNGFTKTAAKIEYSAGFTKTAEVIEAHITSCYSRGFGDCDTLLNAITE